MQADSRSRRLKKLRKSLELLREARAILGGAGDDDKLRDVLISTDTLIEHIALAPDRRRRSEPRPLDPAATRRTGVKGPTTDQHTSCFRDALRLLREARVFIIAARDAAGERRIAYVIEGVRALMGLPPDPLMVLSERMGGVFRAIAKETRLADAECPEMQRLMEEMGRRDAPFEDSRLERARDRIVETNDKYAEVRRLKEEKARIYREIAQIGEADPSGLRAIDSVANQFVRDLAMKSRW